MSDNRYSYWIFAITLLATFNAHAFDATEIDCTLRIPPEQHAYMESLKNNPDSDLYLVAYHEKILTDTAQWANQGNPEAMLVYGALAQEMMIQELRYGTKDHPQPANKKPSKYLPDSYKDAAIKALTYNYVAVYSEDEYQVKAKDALNLLNERSSLKIPSEWRREAETNATEWQAHCQNNSEAPTSPHSPSPAPPGSH